MKVFLLILVIIIAAVVYFVNNWQKYGTFIKTSDTQEVEIAKLVSIANFYNGKVICTKGYYIESEGSTYMKMDLADQDIFKKSAWINNQSGEKFFVDAIQGDKAALFKVCGKFESGRTRGFGQPAVWTHQIIVEDFKQLEKTRTINN